MSAALTALYTAAMEALAVAQGEPVNCDDMGMVDAHESDMLAWVDDLEARVGLNVADFRAALVNYLLARDSYSVARASRDGIACHAQWLAIAAHNARRDGFRNAAKQTEQSVRVLADQLIAAGPDLEPVA